MENKNRKNKLGNTQREIQIRQIRCENYKLGNYKSEIRIGKTIQQIETERTSRQSTKLERPIGKTQNGKYKWGYTKSETAYRKMKYGKTIRNYKSESTNRKIRFGKHISEKYTSGNTNRKNSRTNAKRCNLRHCNITNPHPGGVLGAYTYRHPKVGGQ